MKNALQFGLSLLLLTAFCLSATAVIIAGGDGSGNTSAPTDDPGWDRVGHIAIANPNTLSSVTYIGDKWFITAYHVKHFDNPTGVVVNGSSYAIDSGSWVRITNAVSGLDADLSIFQITAQPDVLPLRIRSSQIPNNADVVMIGDGRNRSSSLTYWNSSWQVTNAASGVYSGYVWAAGSTMRWGENRVSSRSSFNDGFGTQNGFQTTFNAGAGSNECQAATYDSGGGVFYKNGSNWELAGVILTVAGYSGQPASRAVYGNKTYIADISYYRDQITNQIVNFDSDIDGLPDWWESQHTNSATAMSASADSDGDGFTNLDEWYSDTNPTNDMLFFDNTGTLTLTNQTFTFDGSTNRKYQVLYTTNDLADSNLTWVAHGSSVLGAGSNTTITVTNLEDTVFYRIWVTLP